MVELSAGDDLGVAPNDGGTVAKDGVAVGRAEDPLDLAVPDWPHAVRTHRNPAARPIRFMTRQRFWGEASYGSVAMPWSRWRLRWATFSDAANQAGLSRRYGGIHFEEGELAGLKPDQDGGDVPATSPCDWPPWS
jgi:hypothetical protein